MSYFFALFDITRGQYTERHEVSSIIEKSIILLLIERSGEEGSEWLNPPLGGINLRGKDYICLI